MAWDFKGILRTQGGGCLWGAVGGHIGAGQGFPYICPNGELWGNKSICRPWWIVKSHGHFQGSSGKWHLWFAESVPPLADIPRWRCLGSPPSIPATKKGGHCEVGEGWTPPSHRENGREIPAWDQVGECRARWVDVGLHEHRVGKGEKQLAALGCQFPVVADSFPHEPSRCSVDWNHIRHGGTSSCFWLRTTAGGRSSRGSSAGHSKGMERGSPEGQNRDLKAAFGLPDTSLTPTWTPSISLLCGTEKSWLKAEGP